MCGKKRLPHVGYFCFWKEDEFASTDNRAMLFATSFLFSHSLGTNAISKMNRSFANRDNRAWDREFLFRVQHTKRNDARMIDREREKKIFRVSASGARAEREKRRRPELNRQTTTTFSAISKSKNVHRVNCVAMSLLIHNNNKNSEEEEEAVGTSSTPTKRHKRRSKKKKNGSAASGLVSVAGSEEVHRDWQRISDRLKLLMQRMADAASGQLVTDEQMKSFEIISHKVVKDLSEMRHKITSGTYGLHFPSNWCLFQLLNKCVGNGRHKYTVSLFRMK